MRPFLGIDITNDKNNEKINGDRFIVATPSIATSRSLEQASEEQFDMLDKHAKLPPAAQLLYAVCAIVALLGLIAGFIIVGIEEIDTLGFFTHNWWLPAVWIASVIVIAVSEFVMHTNEKKVTDSDEYKRLDKKADCLLESISAELGIPDDAAEADILTMIEYKVKDGEIEIHPKNLKDTVCANDVMRVFTDDKNLYLADWDNKYAIPLASLCAIHTVNKKISLLDWNKDTPANKGEYKQYKLSTDKYGTVTAGKYHILEFDHGGEVWGIYFPCYEQPVFESLTGLKAEEIK